MTAIFISHSSADNVAAADMKTWLEAQGHTSLFLDFDPEAGIKGGTAWEQTLYQQLRQCQAVIALLTPSWLASKWCFAELVQARERGKAIFPVKVQPCEAGDVFGDIQHIDLTAQPEEGYRRLKIGLVERGLDPLDVFDWDPKRLPYPGLLAFQEADAAIFFGRGEEILKTLETLDGLRRQGREAARFGLLLGASGSGKSSLVRAGVIPRLKKKPAEWLPVPPFRPQLEPLDELAMALAAAFAGHGRSRDWSAIRTELHTAAARNPVDGLALPTLARELALTAQQPETTVLLTIDQAEELFGYSPPEAATRFLRLLRVALEAADRRVMAIATLRSDFLGEFQNHPVLQDGEYAHHFRYQAVPVDPMPLRNFPAIIQGPARLAGLQLDDGLVEAIVQDTGTRDALPLLAFTLRRLYERYGDDGRLTVGEYESLGRLEGAIREEAQQVIAEADPTREELEALHAAFVPTMVRINAEGDYARRRALLATMTQRAVPLLRRFVDARLLVTDRDAQGRETIEVAHEALLRTWPQLSGWLAEDRDKLRLLESIQRSAEEWDQGGRRDDLLIHRNGRLKDAEALLANPRFTMPEVSTERAYLVACSAAQQAREAAEKEEQERRIRDAEQIAEEQKRRAEEQTKAAKKLRRLLGIAIALAVVLAGLITLAGITARKAEVEQLHALRVSSEQFLLANQDLEALTTIIKVGRKLESSIWQAVWPEPNLRGQVTETLHKIFYRVKEWQRLSGHQDRVFEVTFSPNGKLVATTAFTSHTVRFWNLHGQQVPTLQEHQGVIVSASFSPNGKLVATADKNGIARLSDLEGKQVAQLAGSVWQVIFSPNGALLATIARDNSVGLWDMDGKQSAVVGEHKDYVTSVIFSPDSKLLATTEARGTIRLWDLDGKPVTEFRVEERELNNAKVAFSPDSQFLATAENYVNGHNTRVRMWDLRGKQVAEFNGHTGSVDNVTFSPDGKLLATASHDQTARLWDLQGHPGAELKGHEHSVRRVVFSPDGQQIATASWDGTARLWDLQGNLMTVLRGHRGGVDAVSFSPDGKLLATSGDDRTARLWNLEGKQVAEFHQHLYSVRVYFSPNGELLAVAGHEISTGNQTISLWNWSGKKLVEFINHGASGVLSLYDVALSPNGQLLVTAEEGGVARLWNLEGKQLLDFKADRSRLLQVHFSPDSQLLATAGIEGIPRLWNLKGEKLAEFKANTRLMRFSFSPDNQLLTTAGEDGSVYLWDLKGNQKTNFKGHQGNIWDISFSPDGQQLATAGEDRIARLWDLKGKRLAELKGHQGSIFNLSFSPKGKNLATAGDRTARLWDLNGNQLAEFSKERANMHDVSFSPDGRQLITVDDDGNIDRWWIEGFNALIVRGCNWVSDYLKNNLDVETSDRILCDGIGAKK